MTGYSAGMRDKRIDILNRAQSGGIGKYGRDSAGIDYAKTVTVWASVTWAKGMRAMNEGAIDAYGVVLIRMNWNDKVNQRSRIVYDGETYQILPETFHADKQANTIQFTAQVLINKK